jgi:steroid delta-isomerase-like uncharacterized protein
MTSAQIMQVMTQYNNLWKPSNLEQADKVLDPGFTRHGTSGRLKGIPAFKEYVTQFLRAFPDLRFTLEDWVAQGEKVVIRYQFTGTHKDDFMGIPATGRRVSAEGVCIYRMADGKLHEMWDFLDMFGVVEQLGLVQFALQKG